jgi:hypothetical protein
MKINKCEKCGRLIYDDGPVCTTCADMDAARSKREAREASAHPPEPPAFRSDEVVAVQPYGFESEPAAAKELRPASEPSETTEPQEAEPIVAASPGDAAQPDEVEPAPVLVAPVAEHVDVAETAESDAAEP